MQLDGTQKRVEIGAILEDVDLFLLAFEHAPDSFPPEPQRGNGVLSGMLGDVLEPFEAAVVDGGLAILGEASYIVEFDGERHARAPRDLAEGCIEPGIGEERRVDAVRRRTELVERV